LHLVHLRPCCGAEGELRPSIGVSEPSAGGGEDVAGEDAPAGREEDTDVPFAPRLTITKPEDFLSR
jgi:hypothetical protein